MRLLYHIFRRLARGIADFCGRTHWRRYLQVANEISGCSIFYVIATHSTYRLQHNTQNYNRIYVYKADSDSILILLLTNVQGCAIMKLSDREVPYQALLFKKMIGWNLMNGGGRYGIIPVL